MAKFNEGDKVVRISAAINTNWCDACNDAGHSPHVVCTIIRGGGNAALELSFADGGQVRYGHVFRWGSEHFRLATGLEVQQGVALPAEDHIVEKESHIECLRHLLDGEKAKVEYLTNQVQDLQGQLDLAKTMVAESNDQCEAAKLAAKSFGEDIMAMRRNARHERYDSNVTANAHCRILRALCEGVADLDLDDLAKQLNHIARMCDEQDNGADAKLCSEAASALTIASRAVEDWRDL